MNPVIGQNEQLIRHVMSHHYDENSQSVQKRAFDTQHIQEGLSVSRKSLLNPQVKTNIIMELEKEKKHSHVCDLEALKHEIENIRHEGSQAYEVHPAPLLTNRSHAKIVYSPYFPKYPNSIIKQMRDELMIVFGV